MKGEKKIGKDIFGKGYDIKEDMFCLIKLINEGEYDRVYVQIEGDSSINFSENLKDKWFEPTEDVFAIKKYGHRCDSLVYFL